MKSAARDCSPIAPKWSFITLRLCVPLIQRFRALNWNFASSGCSATAPSVASRVGVSMPWRGGLGALAAGFSMVAVVIVVFLFGS